MTARHLVRYAAVMMILSTGAELQAAAGTHGDTDVPETVMVTLHAKPGGEAALAGVLARHWETARRLHLVLDAPHLTIRATESGNHTYFVDIFTWRDAGIPDAAPAEIRAIWNDMNRLVESRGGRPGLSISEVTILGVGGEQQR